MNTEVKNCQNCKAAFTIESEDFSFYEKIKVPPPTWCPECRMQRRISWRNEKTMYRRKCDATGKEMFTMFHPSAPFKVYERDYWWSDAWDSAEYGREVDFSRPFLAQLRELMSEVPWYSRSVLNLVNSDYSMNCSDQKDCYLTFHSTSNERCYYGVGLGYSKDCFDGLFLNKCELSYDSFSIANCYKVFYSSRCEDCQDLWFCKDCVNCSDCVGCVGLRNKKYHIFNEPHSKEEYEKKVRDMRLGTFSGVSKVAERFRSHALRYPNRYLSGKQNVNTSGDYIFHSKNVKDSYIMENVEDSRYCQNVILSPGAKDCYDYSFFGMNAERIYESCSVGIDSADIQFSVFIYPGAERQRYCIMCPSSSDLFGCVGLRRKKYCILNKQYSKEEYEALMPRVIEYMNNVPYVDSAGRIYRYGEFFPFEFSPFGYNETIAQEYHPITKEEASSSGIHWNDPVEKTHQPTLSWKELPDDIENVEEDIVKEVILCRAWDEEGSERALEHNCSMAFRIVPEELQFYKRMNLPLPRKCFNSRHYDRTLRRNPHRLHSRACQCAGSQSERGIFKNTATHFHNTNPCPNEFETSYAPDRPEIVYCESCYQSEVA